MPRRSQAQPHHRPSLRLIVCLSVAADVIGIATTLYLRHHDLLPSQPGSISDAGLVGMFTVIFAVLPGTEWLSRKFRR